MQFKNWDFASLALKYVKAAADNIVGPPLFRPDGKTLTQIGAMLTTGQGLFNALITKEHELDGARAALNGAAKAAHDACVAVFPCMKSCYRSDRTLLAAIKRFPTEDDAPAETLSRIKTMHGFWTNNPNVPGGSTPFVVGQVDLTAFTALFEDLDEKQSDFTTCDGKRASQAVRFTDHLKAISQFVTHALVQGRSAYAKGTADREYIDAIPTRPATHKPGQAVIIEAESNEPGFVHLLAEAEHATRFTFLHKGPGELVFAVVQDGEADSYDAVNVEPGQHEYKVAPHNSRGDGPESEVVIVTVAAQAVA